MLEDSVPNFACEVQALAILFQVVHDPQTLLIMVKSAWYDFVEYPFTPMTKGCVPEIMSQSNGLNKILIQRKSTANCPPNL